MAEKESQKSKRAVLMERMKARHPDREYADDEALFEQIDSDYAASDEEIGKYKEREQILTDGFSRDPRAANFFVRLLKGENPWSALVEMVGVDGVAELLNDPAKQEEFAEANKAYVERLAKEKSLEEEYQVNFAASMKTLEQVQTEQGLSDETIDAAMDMVMGIVNDAIVGKFSRETIETALKAINHDAEVEAAREEGVIAGKNAKIDEKLRKSKAGDGLPAIGGANASVATKKKNSFFDDLPQRKF